MSAKTAIDPLPEPITAGPRRAKNSLTRAQRTRARRSKRPRRWAERINSPSCSAPETTKPQLAATPTYPALFGLGKKKAKAIAAMTQTFISNGAKAASAKRPCVLSVP